MKLLLLTMILSTYSFCDFSIFISQNNKLTKVSNEDLANLYLKKTNTINGIEVIPIDSKNKEVFQEFYEKIVKKTPSQLHAYWMKQIYTGDTQPPKKLSKNELKQAMIIEPKIIAYSCDIKNARILLTIK